MHWRTLIDELVLNLEKIPLKMIVTRPAMAQVRSLTAGISGEIDAAAIQALVESPHTAGLRELSLNFTECGREGAHWLAKATFLAQLRLLGLHNAQIGRKGLHQLLARNAFEHLRTLDLSNNNLDGEAVAHLSKCDSMQFLELLNLDNNKNAWDGLPALAEATFARALLSLTISSMNPIAADLAGFAQDTMSDCRLSWPPAAGWRNPGWPRLSNPTGSPG